mgnify:CR=1 FL=1
MIISFLMVFCSNDKNKVFKNGCGLSKKHEKIKCFEYWGDFYLKHFNEKKAIYFYQKSRSFQKIKNIALRKIKKGDLKGARSIFEQIKERKWVREIDQVMKTRNNQTRFIDQGITRSIKKGNLSYFRPKILNSLTERLLFEPPILYYYQHLKKRYQKEIDVIYQDSKNVKCEKKLWVNIDKNKNMNFDRNCYHQIEKYNFMFSKLKTLNLLINEYFAQLEG